MSFKEPLWTKDYILNIVNNFLLFIIFYMLMVYTTSFAISSFNASVSEAGLASGTFILGALVSRLFSGRYLDFVGRRKMLLFSACLYLLSTVSYHFIMNMMFLLVLRFVQGAAYGMISTVIATEITSIIPKSRRGEGIGYFTLSITLGSAIGPFLGITLPKINPVYPLYFCDIIAVTIVIVSLATKVHAIVPGFRQRVEVKSLRLRTFIETTALPISFIGFLGAIGFASIMSFIGTYSEVIDLAFAGSIFFIVYSLACLVFRPLFGILLDRYGNHVVMFPVLFAMITGFMAIALADSSFTLLLGAVLVGTGYGSIPSAGQAIAVQKVKPNRFSLATSTLYMSLDAGSGVGPYLLGMIVPVYGFRSVYVCASLLAVVALIFYCGNIFFSRKKNA